MLLTSFNKHTIRVLLFFLVFSSVLVNHNSIYAQPDATFEFTYDDDMPQEAIDAFEFALSIISDVINSEVPIRAHVGWSDLSSLANPFLARTTTNYILWEESGFYVEDVILPQALYNSITGYDVNEDISDFALIEINSDKDWYFGTDGVCPADKYDLVSTSLHELLHGLGFGSGTIPNPTGSGFISNNDGVARVFDLFVSEGPSFGGTTLPNLQGTALTNAVTGNYLYFKGENAREYNHGDMLKLYAPNTWVPGSSLSHIDDDLYSLCEGEHPNILMEKNTLPGEVTHVIGPAIIGVLKDIGWSVNCASDGCDDPNACNYDPEMCPSEGLLNDACIYGDNYFIPTSLPGGIQNACNGSCNYDDLIADSDYMLADQSCIEQILEDEGWDAFLNGWSAEHQAAYNCCQNYGCADDTACNFDSSVCTEENSLCVYCSSGEHCITINMTDSNSDGWDGAMFFIDTGQYSINGYLEDGASGSQSICLWEGCFTFEVLPGNTPNQIGWEISGLPGGPISSSPGSNVGSFDFAIGWDNIGCTDESACNYEGACIEPQVIIGGGDACTYPSCFDDNACNFIPPGPDDCPDNSLCIYGSDNSVPSITLTEWFISVEPITFSGWDGFILDYLIFEDQNGQLNFGGDELFGTWTLCEGEITLTGDNGNIYFANYDFINGDFQGMVLDNVFNPIGTFAMYPLQTVGCIDSSACNYNPLADYDDDSCDYISCADCCGVPNGDGSSCDGDCGPCGDNTSCLDACGVPNGDNSSCTDCCGVINGYGYTCDGDCGPCGDSTSCLDECGVINGDNTSCADCCGVPNGNGSTCDGDCGPCGDISCYGCTDSGACNFLPFATIDDGNCTYSNTPVIEVVDFQWLFIIGCYLGAPELEQSFNINNTWELNNFEGQGYWTLCESDLMLYRSDGSLLFDGSWTIEDNTFAGEYYSQDGIIIACSKIQLIASSNGCTDAIACNFDSSASVDDGNCDYYSSPPTNLLDTEWYLEYDWGCNNGGDGIAIWTLNSDFTFESSTGSAGNWSLCGLSVTLLFGGVNGTEYNGDYNIAGGYFEGTMNGSPSNCFTMSPVVVEGCTDSTACNYNASANTDDGSCIYPTCDDPLACNYDECSDPISICYDATACYDASACTYAIGWSLGCTYIDAINYDPIATVDDGSCEYDLPSICGAGTYYDAVTSSCIPDGTGTGDGCPGDLDNDGFVNTNDLLLFLAVFGTTCP